MVIPRLRFSCCLFSPFARGNFILREYHRRSLKCTCATDGDGRQEFAWPPVTCERASSLIILYIKIRVIYIYINRIIDTATLFRSKNYRLFWLHVLMNPTSLFCFADFRNIGNYKTKRETSLGKLDGAWVCRVVSR